MLIAGSIALGILVVLLITAFTGYFVAQEFAYMAVDRSSLKARAKSGDAAAERALSVTRRTSFMLSGAQLGITVTGLLVGYVAEPLIGRGVGQLLGIPGVPTAVAMGIGAVFAVLFSTVVQMVFGELFPKNLAIARPDAVARRLARSTTLYLALFGWLIKLFDASSNLLLKALRIEPVHDVEHSATARDLEHIVAESRDAGELPVELSRLLDRILDFPTRTAAHAMLPWGRVDVVDAHEPIADVLARMAQGHTRYPVREAGKDEFAGVVDMHDLLEPGITGTAGTLCRPAVIIPDALPLPDVVTTLKDAGQEMALVIDEYGDFAGILTIEDLAEELVGEIADEHDPDQEAHEVVDDGNGWLIPGDTHLDEVERILDLDLAKDLLDGDYETLGGIVIALFGGLPEVGDSVRIALAPVPEELLSDDPVTTRYARAEVRAVDRHVPASVLVTLDERVAATGGETDG